MEQVGILASSSPHERPQRGGFLPIFWDVPRANTHAVEDIGAVVDWLTERCDFRADAKSNLAVLRNRNDMTNLFRASNWVSSSQDSIVSRQVTTCAGMTAHTVILAQTRVGFLTGGRKKYFRTIAGGGKCGLDRQQFCLSISMKDSSGGERESS